MCGNWDCPVLLVTGDEAACREAKALLGDGLTTVAVKKGIGSEAARNLAPLLAREVIEEGAKNALKELGAVKPYDPGRPAVIEVDFMQTAEVAKYRGRTGVEVTGPRSIVVRADDWWTAWRNLFLEPSLP
jgi:D-amino peptidase